MDFISLTNLKYKFINNFLNISKNFIKLSCILSFNFVNKFESFNGKESKYSITWMKKKIVMHVVIWLDYFSFLCLLIR